MQWMKARVCFEHPEPGLAEDLISDIFYEMRLQGVVVESPDPEPADEWWDETVERPEAHAVIGYIPPDRRRRSENRKPGIRIDPSPGDPPNRHPGCL